MLRFKKEPLLTWATLGMAHGVNKFCAFWMEIATILFWRVV
jgi:hypothetical protein